LRVGFFESVVFGGAGRQVELYYLNPIIFFHGSQLNEGTDDNTFIGLDFDYKPFERVKLYCQALVDDFQIDNETQGDREPNEIGLMFGVYSADIASGLDVKAEYTRVTNRTYNQGLSRNLYLYNGEPISAAHGNDFDLATLSLIGWLSDVTAASLNLRYARQGEGRVTDEWTTPWLDVVGDYSEPFPTGVVWKTARMSLRLKSFVKTIGYVDIEAGLDQVRNFNHTAGDNRSLPFIRIDLSAIFSGSVKIH
jgi:hypothetical protein